MNTAINSNQNSIVELAKRTFYSFQVLILGIAIPFLFLVGISNINEKNVPEPQVKETTNVNQQPVKPVVGLLIPEI
jgi:hypothetical protein